MDVILKDGILSFNGTVDKKDMRKLYNKFRVDLLDANIPHYRPVAFALIGSISVTVIDNITKIPLIGYSYSELSFILSKLILADKDGVMPKAFLDNPNPSFIEDNCSFVVLNGTSIGSTSDGSMFYEGRGFGSTPPRTLIKEFTLLDKLKKPITVSLVLLKGTGELDFSDNQRFVYKTKYKPIRTYYSLYDIFKIREYLEGENHFTLHYEEDVDEEVLRDILYEYFNSEEVKNAYI